VTIGAIKRERERESYLISRLSERGLYPFLPFCFEVSIKQRNAELDALVLFYLVET